MRSLYVMSKALEGKPRLIGILSEDNGEFQFEYKLNGKIQEWFLVLKEFPDVTKKYGDTEVQSFVKKFLPPRNYQFLQQLMESVHLSEYDEWEMLKVFGKINMQEDAYLFEKLPEGAILYENLDAAKV